MCKKASTRLGRRKGKEKERHERSLTAGRSYGKKRFFLPTRKKGTEKKACPTGREREEEGGGGTDFSSPIPARLRVRRTASTLLREGGGGPRPRALEKEKKRREESVEGNSLYSSV